MTIVYLTIEEISELKPYPTADIFPMLLDEADPPKGYDGLTLPQFADQILKEGIREPLVIWNGFLIDGRNRRAAAQKAHSLKPAELAELTFTPVDLSTLPVRYADFETEEEADSWVLSLNIDRRAMNKDQLACLAVKYWEIVEVNRVGRPSSEDKGAENSAQFTKKRDALASRFHVNKDYIQKARSLYINDRSKFDKAASGRERVLGKLISPGQKIKPDTDPNELALTQVNDAFAKMKTAMSTLAKAEGESYASAKNNVEAKINRLMEHFNEEFKH